MNSFTRELQGNGTEKWTYDSMKFELNEFPRWVPGESECRARWSIYRLESMNMGLGATGKFRTGLNHIRQSQASSSAGIGGSFLPVGASPVSSETTDYIPTEHLITSSLQLESVIDSDESSCPTRSYLWGRE